MARRVYTVSFSGVAITAVQDLIALYCGSSMAIELHSFTLGQITATAVQNLRISVKRLPATVTPGSGGGPGTVRKASNGDAAATATARINDTSIAASSGTAETLLSTTWSLVNGCEHFWPADDRPTAGLGQAFVLSLDSAPVSSITCSGTLTFAELF